MPAFCTTFAILAALLVAPADAAFARTCNLEPVHVTNHAATTRGHTVQLGEADSPLHPTAWQGPLRITRHGGTTCTAAAEVAIIETPLLMARNVLYVPTYSGSTSVLYAINLTTCAVMWQSQPYTGKATYSHGKWLLGRHHLPVALDEHCDVKAAQAKP